MFDLKRDRLIKLKKHMFLDTSPTKPKEPQRNVPTHVESNLAINYVIFFFFFADVTGNFFSVGSY